MRRSGPLLEASQVPGSASYADDASFPGRRTSQCLHWVGGVVRRWLSFGHNDVRAWDPHEEKSRDAEKAEGL